MITYLVLRQRRNNVLMKRLLKAVTHDATSFMGLVAEKF